MINEIHGRRYSSRTINSKISCSSAEHTTMEMPSRNVGGGKKDLHLEKKWQKNMTSVKYP